MKTLTRLAMVFALLCAPLLAEETQWIEKTFQKFGLSMVIPDDADLRTEDFEELPRWGGAHCVGAGGQVEIWGLSRIDSDPDPESVKTLARVLTGIPIRRWEKLEDYSSERDAKGLSRHATYRTIDGSQACYILVGKTRRGPGSAVMLFVRGPVGSFGEHGDDWDHFYDNLAFLD